MPPGWRPSWAVPSNCFGTDMPVRYKRPIKRSPKSDPQQYRVYRMESEAIGARHWLRISRQKVGQFVRAVCRTYGIPPLTIRFENHRRWAAYFQAPSLMVFSKKATARDLLTAAHEFGHYLHYVVAGEESEKHATHGPEFMACYMSVLDTIRFIPIEAMAVLCDERKIKYVRPKEGMGVDQLRKLTCGRHRP